MPEFSALSVTDPRAHGLLEEYFHGRELGFVGGSYRVTFPTPAQFEPPAGVFLVLSDGGQDVGCGGIRMLDEHRAEVKHLYLHEETRGKGWGRILLAELERRAIAFGARESVLDTNATLEAAAGLYRSSGYVSVPPYNDNPNATNWYSKVLRLP